MSNTKSKIATVYGWGIVDVDYILSKHIKVNGKNKVTWICPYYVKWHSLVQRAKSSTFKSNWPTYKDCTICEEWRTLSGFIKWVDIQPNRDWQNCEPDKDLLYRDNKHYSPETAVFVPRQVNGFLKENKSSRGTHMTGANFNPSNSKSRYQANCKNPWTKKTEYLGSFRTELEAHLAWKAKKHEHACKLADLQEDPRVAEALRTRYAPDTDWTRR